MAVTTSPFFGIQYGWETGASGWGDPVNTNLKVMSFLDKGAVDDFVSSLPGSPSVGDSYVLTTDNLLYVRFAEGWVFITPQKNQQITKGVDGTLWQYNGSSWDNLITAKELSQSLLNNSNTTKGSALVGVVPSAPAGVGTTAYEIFNRTINVLDVLSAAEKTDVHSRTGSIDLNTKIQTLLNNVPDYSHVVFTEGVYLNSGAVGLVVNKPMTLLFEKGAVLKFNNNNATYLSTLASDINIINIEIDGGSSSWTRTGNAAIRIKTNGSPVSNINIVSPRIHDVAGAGILVGWSDEIGDVTIDKPVVYNTQADGVSVAYNTRDVSIVAPRCYNTGDDGVSIVAYNTAAAPVRRVEITDALSYGSHTRGITVIGGEDIRVTGKSINATAQGALVLQDAGTYNTYAPKRVEIDISIYNSTGNGIEIGRNAEDISGSIKAVGCAGARGVLIGSAAGTEPKRVNFGCISAYNCAATGIEIGRVINSGFGSLLSSENGTIGVAGTNSTNLSIGSIIAYNNNTTNVAGVDNIFFNTVTNFTVGSVTSTDDRSTTRIERTFDLASCTNGVIGPFNGVKFTTVNVVPNIQATCTNVRVSGEVTIKAGIPSVSEIPVRGFVIDTTDSRVYFAVSGVAKYATLT